MGGRSSKIKGANGEREVADIIYYATGIKVERNLDQTRGGGHDLNGIDGLSIEVKRQETLCIPAWWRQTLRQAEDVKGIPVLVYRQNRKPWTFIVGLDKKQMTQVEFLKWLLEFIKLAKPTNQIDPVPS